jgi:hypothetical protein
MAVYEDPDQPCVTAVAKICDRLPGWLGTTIFGAGLLFGPMIVPVVMDGIIRLARRLDR